MINSLYPKFRDWSAEGSVYLYSDPHFDDPEVTEINPDWISSLNQVGIINEVAHKNDTIIILGDLGDSHYLEYLNSRVIVLLGNHDDKRKTVIASRCHEMYEGPLFIGEKILLSHEPIYGLDFCMNIHGHVHGRPATDIYHYNVCADVIGFTPVSLGTLIKNGLISRIPSIHRLTIDEATARTARIP